MGAFFRQGRGYVGTELLRDVEHPGPLPRHRPLGVRRGVQRVRRARTATNGCGASTTRGFHHEQELRFGTFETVWD